MPTKSDVAWFLVVAVLSSAWCVTAGARLGPTFDENLYLTAGVDGWRTGSNKQLMSWGAMPLPIDAVTLPIYLWERGRGEPFSVLDETPRLLPVARAAALPFWWAVLFYGMLWGRTLGGPAAGRLALCLIGCDPNLLAHAALAATDIALTATVLAATYHFFTGRDHGWKRRVLLPGILYGVALTAKASALVYVPLLCGVLGLWHADWRQPWASTARLRWDLAGIIVIGTGYLFAYCGSDWTAERTFVEWARTVPHPAGREIAVAAAENLRIFPNAGEGIVQQIRHNLRGHGGSFLLGEYHPKEVWYYFPAALSVKLPEATLLLLAAVVLLRPRALGSPAGLAALVLLAFSLNTRVQIGVRLVFPLVTFLYVALAVAVSGRRRNPEANLFPPSPLRGEGWGGGESSLPGEVATPHPNPPPQRGRGPDGFCKLLAWLAVACTAYSSVVVWPDGLRYTNHLRGGPDRGCELLNDSNYDWGQGLPELKEWWHANGEPPLCVWFFGTDPAILKPPFRHLPVHMLPDKSPPAVVDRIPPEGYFAVSVTLLYGTPAREPDTLAFVDWLRTQEPVAKTGTFRVYRLPR